MLTSIDMGTRTPGMAGPPAIGGPSPLHQWYVLSAERAAAASWSTLCALTVGSAIGRIPCGSKPVLEIETNSVFSWTTRQCQAKATSAGLDATAKKLRMNIVLEHHWKKWRKRCEKNKAWKDAISAVTCPRIVCSGCTCPRRSALTRSCRSETGSRRRGGCLSRRRRPACRCSV